MEPSLIFTFGNTFVLIGWLLLLFLPKWRYSQDIIMYGVIAILSILYVVLIAPTLINFNPEAFSTLDNVKALFQQDNAVAAGWLHYLAFDLFVGTYIVREGIRLGLPRWKFTLPLPFTFMFGPIGLLVFLLLKWTKK